MLGRSAGAAGICGLVLVWRAPIFWDPGILSLLGILRPLERSSTTALTVAALQRADTDKLSNVYTDAKSAALCPLCARIAPRGVGCVCRHSEAVTYTVPAPDGASDAHECAATDDDCGRGTGAPRYQIQGSRTIPRLVMHSLA